MYGLGDGRRLCWNDMEGGSGRVWDGVCNHCGVHVSGHGWLAVRIWGKRGLLFGFEC